MYRSCSNCWQHCVCDWLAQTLPPFPISDSRTPTLLFTGDHKQLRPKVEHYELSVQAGRGHSLNVSLFERLVQAGMPHATLAVQHRMHPDISRLIRHTYPDLQVREVWCVLLAP